MRGRPVCHWHAAPARRFGCIHSRSPRAGQRITQRTLRIGVSARIFHPEPGGKGLRGKTLQYL
ncbi:hypothetical protein KQH58_16100, partial [Mycetohabitans sp. B6]|nr:hypothetical protein [Mycetohabitans sp. B6]